MPHKLENKRERERGRGNGEFIGRKMYAKLQLASGTSGHPSGFRGQFRVDFKELRTRLNVHFLVGHGGGKFMVSDALIALGKKRERE